MSLPLIYKGIALFTPGGDLIYAIDPDKQDRWHLHLCAALQEILGLPEPPHFLVPCYTATVDRWRDPASGQIQTAADVYPLVFRYQAILNVIFQSDPLPWKVVRVPEELCNPMVLASYRTSFPQLWECHDLMICLGRNDSRVLSSWSAAPSAIAQPSLKADEAEGYVLRLFVSGHGANTARTLQNLHELLETALPYPYTLKVVDVFKNPEQAEEDQISATPTLLRVWPQPVRRLVGDLDNPERILQFLNFPNQSIS